MKSSLRLTIFSLALAASSSSKAASVYINSGLVTATGNGTTAAQMKLRAGRNANWDSAFANGVGFGVNNSRRTDMTANFSAGQTYQFSLENRPGQGLIYTVRPAGGSDTVVAWGTFSSSVPGTVVTTLGNRSVPTNFNTITFQTLATLAGSSASVSGLAFSSPGLTLADGAWQNVTMTPSTPGNAGTGTSQQSLFSDINMAAVPWTLTGSVSLTRPNAAGAAETIRTLVQVRQTPIQILVPVPEPGFAALSLLGAGLVLNRRHRR